MLYNKTRYTAIIGSANLTNGGMFHNDECAVLFIEKDDVLLDNVLETLEDYFGKAKIITEDIINEYSKEYKDIKKNNEIIQKRLEPTKQKIDEAPYINLKWKEVIEIIRENKDLYDRIKVLDEIQNIFKNLEKNNKSLNDLMSHIFNKVIGYSGIYVFFGGLRCYYKEPNKKILSNYLGKIKLGLISQTNILDIVEEYLQIIEKEDNIGIATATRLLAVKRPDLFLCVNNGNQDSIKKLFGFEISGKSEIAKYIQLLKMIYNTDYFNHKLTKDEKQDKTLVAISKYRVALLDSMLRKK